MELPGILEFTPKFFNESSKAWTENKIKCGSAYAYKCLFIPTQNNVTSLLHILIYVKDTIFYYYHIKQKQFK